MFKEDRNGGTFDVFTASDRSFVIDVYKTTKINGSLSEV